MVLSEPTLLMIAGMIVMGVRTAYDYYRYFSQPPDPTIDIRTKLWDILQDVVRECGTNPHALGKLATSPNHSTWEAKMRQIIEDLPPIVNSETDRRRMIGVPLKVSKRVVYLAELNLHTMRGQSGEIPLRVEHHHKTVGDPGNVAAAYKYHKHHLCAISVHVVKDDAQMQLFCRVHTS